MEFNRGEIESAATERWGPPNRGLSSRDEMRFGTRGSVSVKLETNEWYDHEIAEGGLVIIEPVNIDHLMPRMVVKKYNYLDEAGRVHMQVRRFMPKDFRQCRPDPDNPSKWIHSVKGLQMIPYRLPEMLASDYVIVCEGEKDCDELAYNGYVATTAPQGANKWPDELSQFFVGKDVYVVPDNDDAGKTHAELVSSKLFAVAKTVRVCDVAKDLAKRADIYDWLQVNDADRLMADLQGFPIVTKPVEPALPVSGGDIFQTIDADDIKAVTSSDDFVEGLLGAGQLSVLYGPSNCGKTFFINDLCLHIAQGKTWRGREVDRGGVLYVAAEGSFGIRNRIAAYKQHYQIEDTIPLTILPSTVNMLDTQADVEKLIRTIQFKAQELGNISLIVLDTLARVMAGGNENAAEDMGMLVINCDRISQTTGAHVCLVHHSGKDESKGSRGSSSLRAACSTEIEIKKAGDVSIATVTKQREMEIDGVFAFSLDVINIGTNDRGKPVTSCVVKEIDSSDVVEKKRRFPRGANQKILFKAIKNLGANGKLHPLGIKVNGFELPKSCLGISIDEFFDATKGKISCEIKHKKTRFNEAISSLVADDFIGLEEGYLWLIP